MHNRKVRSMNLGIFSQSWKFYNTKFNPVIKAKRRKPSEIGTTHNLEFQKELNSLSPSHNHLFKYSFSATGTEKPLKLDSLTTRTSSKKKPIQKILIKKSNALPKKGDVNNGRGNGILGISEGGKKESDFVLSYVENKELKGRYVRLLSKKTISEALPIIKPVYRDNTGANNTFSPNYLRMLSQKNHTINKNMNEDSPTQEIIKPKKKRNDAIIELCRSIDYILGSDILVPL